MISNLILVSYRRFRVVHLLERLIFVVEYASKLNLKQICEIKTTIITESYRAQSISDLEYNFQILFSQEINDSLQPTENATDFWR